MSSDVYDKLSESLGFPRSEHLPQILERMFTPEEGKLILELNTPTDEIARKLNIDEDVVKKRLEELKLRGVILPLSTVMPGLEGNLFGLTFEDLRAQFLITAKKYMSAEAFEEFMNMLKEFYKAEWCQNQGIYYGSERSTHTQRVIPARKAFQSTPDISPGKILPDEDLTRIFENAGTICVIPCPCKSMWQSCDAPREVCIQFGQWAEHILWRGGGRKLSLEEALAISDSAEEAGLVHTMNIVASVMMCNCCKDCCIIIDPARKYGTLSKAIIKSHYRSTIDQDECIGCEDCIDRCPFDAIKMEKDSSGELKAAVDEEKCYGCGVCVVACPPEAITMKLVES